MGLQALRFYRKYQHFCNPVRLISTSSVRQQKQEGMPKTSLPRKWKPRPEDRLQPILGKLIADFEQHELRTNAKVAALVPRMLKYNAPGAHRFVVSDVRELYQLVEDPDKITAANLNYADIASCCLRVVAAMITLGDDMVDEGEERYGKACWYSLAPSKEVAINDSWIGVLLPAKLVIQQLADAPFYPRALEIMIECFYGYLAGQYIDLSTVAESRKERVGKPINISGFSDEILRICGAYKMAEFIVIKPVEMALAICGEKFDNKNGSTEREIGDLLGYLYLVQNDFLDCYGGESYDKVGTDIEVGKCSWLIVKALERANGGQRQILENNYGSRAPGAVDKVKQVYDELDMSSVYLEFEEEFRADVTKALEKCSNAKVAIAYTEIMNRMLRSMFH